MKIAKQNSSEAIAQALRKHFPKDANKIIETMKAAATGARWKHRLDSVSKALVKKGGKQ